jgi:branched-chain amino acid transport system ATP-binding protein
MSESSAPLLVLDDVFAFYGNIQALFGVTLDVQEGEVVALLGANGAGKSTTLRSISGVVRGVGRITFAGRRIEGKPPEDVARLGIAHVPEGRGLFRSLTVRENLRTGTFVAPPGTNASEEIERVFEMFPVLRERASQQAATLSGGEQQMLAIGRALVSRPRLLMVDELSLGLAPTIVEELFAVIPRLAAGGTAILLVEQFVEHALRVADRAAVLERGKVGWFGKAKTLARRRGFVEASYLGARPMGNGARDLPETDPFVERVAVPLSPRALRTLQREASVAGRSVEQLLAERLNPDASDGPEGAR